MRVNARITKLERISGTHGPCPECRGEGLALLRITWKYAGASERVEQRGGCGRCGNVSAIKHLILGPRPSLQGAAPNGGPTFA
ncbi:MAG: hypothetical protein H7Y88_03035 [Phycisphaerales bacterium]|nr:hypothetical protein [Phycisphaerales bacterium]